MVKENVDPGFTINIIALLLAIVLSGSIVTMMLSWTSVVPEPAVEFRHVKLAPPVAIDDLKNQKLVALTFDDGPDPYNTNTLLDILRTEKANATFFVLGSRVDRYGQIVQRAYREGHQIASHTRSHQDLTKLSPASRRHEIDSTINSIKQAIGVGTTVMRPPFGSWNADVLRDAGMPLVLWSIDTNDWKYRDAERIYNHVMASVRDGSIVLLHDIHATSVQATAKIIPALKARGYAVVTINRLIMARGGSFAAGKYYYHLYR